MYMCFINDDECNNTNSKVVCHSCRILLCTAHYYFKFVFCPNCSNKLYKNKSLLMNFNCKTCSYKMCNDCYTDIVICKKFDNLQY